MMPAKQNLRRSLSDEKGLVLVTILMLIVVLALLGTTAVIMSTTDLKISGNYKTGNRAFYAAEAGIEEARGRLRKFSPSNPAIEITDAHPTQTQWSAFIGSQGNAQGKGYNSGNAMHLRVASLQSTLDYTVKIIHQTNASGNILYWGDANGDGRPERTVNPVSSTGFSNPNIYLVASYGSDAGANRTLEAEMTRLPPITAPAALYVEASTKIQGTSTNIIGVDQCGGLDKPGVATTLAAGTVTKTGNPIVCGVNNPGCTTAGTWDVTGGTTNLDVQSIIDNFRGFANFPYSVTSATLTGQSWGVPTLGATLQNPSSCAVNNIVYFDTNNTDVKLAGGTSGCGLLLIDGDLEVNGGFSWYGMVIVSGSVTYLGGGDKNITGAVIAGGSVDADLVGGNANIVYCSDAVNNQTANRSLRNLSWMEKM